MKAIRRILTAALCLTLLVVALTLTACNTECAHEYGEWSEAQAATCTEAGVKVRTCSKCGAIDGTEIPALNPEAGHTMGEWTVTEPTCTEAGSKTRGCTTCSHTESETIAATGHKMSGFACTICDHEVVSLESLIPTFSEDIRSAGIVIKDTAFLISDEYRERHEPEGIVNATVELAELVLWVDDNGQLAGYGQGALNFKGVNTDIDNDVTVTVAIEGTEAYVAFKGASELTTTLTYDEFLKIDPAVILNADPEIAEAEVMLTQYLPALETWVKESLLPVFGTPDLDYSEEQLEADARDLAHTLLGLVYVATKTDDGYTVSLDLTGLKELNNTLATKTISELVDSIRGEGTYAGIKLLVPTVLDFTVANLLDFIKLNLGVDVTALLAALDELAVTVSGQPDATFENMIHFEGDIDALLTDETFLATTVADVIASFAASEGEAPDRDQLVQMATAMLDEVAGKTVYELIGMDPTEIKIKVAEVLDAAAAALSHEIKIDKSGKFVSSELGILIDKTEAKITLTPAGITVNVSDDSVALTAELILGATAKVDTEAIAAIKAELETVPSMDEIIDTGLFEELYPVYDDNGNLITFVDSVEIYGTDSSDVDAEGRVAVLIYYEYAHVEDLFGTIITKGCKGMKSASLAFASYNEYRKLYITADEAQDLDNEAALALFSRTDYEVDSIDSDTIDLDFAYEIEADGNASILYANDDNYHNWVATPESEAAFAELTCGNIGVLIYVCDRCDASYTEYRFVEHNYEYNSELSIEPTDCQTLGSEYYGCTDCDAYYTEDWYGNCNYVLVEEKSTIPDKCGDIAYLHYECSACGDYYINHVTFTHEDSATFAHTVENDKLHLEVTCSVCNVLRNTIDLTVGDNVTYRPGRGELNRDLFMDFEYSIAEAGTYRLRFDHSIPSYINTYMHAYYYPSGGGSVWWGISSENGDGYTYIEITVTEPTSGYFTVFLGGAAGYIGETYSGAVYIEKVED